MDSILQQSYNKLYATRWRKKVGKLVAWKQICIFAANCAGKKHKKVTNGCWLLPETRRKGVHIVVKDDKQ